MIILCNEKFDSWASKETERLREQISFMKRVLVNCTLPRYLVVVLDVNGKGWVFSDSLFNTKNNVFSVFVRVSANFLSTGEEKIILKITEKCKVGPSGEIFCSFKKILFSLFTRFRSFPIVKKKSQKKRKFSTNSDSHYLGK